MIPEAMAERAAFLSPTPGTSVICNPVRSASAAHPMATDLVKRANLRGMISSIADREDKPLKRVTTTHGNLLRLRLFITVLHLHVLVRCILALVSFRSLYVLRQAVSEGLRVECRDFHGGSQNGLDPGMAIEELWREKALNKLSNG